MAGDKRIISAATHFGRQMKKERQAHGWTLQEFSVRTAYDGAHLSRIENGLRPPTRALALACDSAFPERHGWFLDYYEESRQWAEVPPGFRDTADRYGAVLTVSADTWRRFTASLLRTASVGHL